MWYKRLKLALRRLADGYNGHYWVLPDGNIVDVQGFHATDGWEYLKQIEPDIDPSEEPGNLEDYEPFFNRGWVRIVNHTGIKVGPTPITSAQISEICSIIRGDEVWIDTPNSSMRVIGTCQEIRKYFNKLQHQPQGDPVLRLAGGTGNYWILRNGTLVDVPGYHVEAGWKYLQDTEPGIGPDDKPGWLEDYTLFFDRGWVRVAGYNNVQIGPQPVTPAQIAELCKISDMIGETGYNSYMWIDTNTDSVRIDANCKAIRRFFLSLQTKKPIMI